MITWAFLILIFVVAAACVFAIGVKVGEEKMRGEQANNERRDEDEWKEIDRD